jgi:hypothetical protein
VDARLPVRRREAACVLTRPAGCSPIHALPREGGEALQLQAIKLCAL